MSNIYDALDKIVSRVPDLGKELLIESDDFPEYEDKPVPKAGKTAIDVLTHNVENVAEWFSKTKLVIGCVIPGIRSISIKACNRRRYLAKKHGYNHDKLRKFFGITDIRYCKNCPINERYPL